MLIKLKNKNPNINLVKIKIKWKTRIYDEDLLSQNEELRTQLPFFVCSIAFAGAPHTDHLMANEK